MDEEAQFQRRVKRPEQRTVLAREVWWKHPPVVGQDPATIEWGWLEIYNDHTSRFFEEQPSDEAIATRKNCWPARAVNPDNRTTRGERDE